MSHAEQATRIAAMAEEARQQAAEPVECELCDEPIKETDETIDGLWGPIHWNCGERAWMAQEQAKVAGSGL